ncbi:unnamed protein product [Clavelina lepadiformis]|uniref:Failed axon connections protein n=1 Tax=Clavelina lepadiformis TaxID=159417 RepID=A0ABP0GAD2_CLALP
MSEIQTTRGDDPDIRVFYFSPTLLTPSGSPFALKLLTYLRMTGLKYKTFHSLKTSSKRKLPFISFKGKEMGDSTFIMQFLNKEFNKDLNSSLSSVEKAASVAFQRLCEENLYWCMVHDRWTLHTERFLEQLVMHKFKKRVIAAYALVHFRRLQKANLYGHGIGRHSNKEIFEIGERDLAALSDFLADKKFFMGSEPTEVDCTVFGTVEQFIECLPGSKYEKLIKEKFSNLIAYTERMKEKFWPDWREQCAQKKIKQKSESQPKPDKENGTSKEEAKGKDQSESADDAQRLSVENNTTDGEHTHASRDDISSENEPILTQ